MKHSLPYRFRHRTQFHRNDGGWQWQRSCGLFLVTVCFRFRFHPCDREKITAVTVAYMAPDMEPGQDAKVIYGRIFWKTIAEGFDAEAR